MGSEMTTGGTIIMPSAIKILETTISTIRNGKKNRRNQSGNADFNSESIYAGTSCTRLTSSMVRGASWFDISAINTRSCSRVCRNINSLSGTAPPLDRFARRYLIPVQGLQVFSLLVVMRSSTGDMMNSASKTRQGWISTVFGGVSCRPSACRNMENTTTMRVEPMSFATMMPGTASARSVRPMTILSAVATFLVQIPNQRRYALRCPVFLKSGDAANTSVGNKSMPKTTRRRD